MYSCPQIKVTSKQIEVNEIHTWQCSYNSSALYRIQSESTIAMEKVQMGFKL